MRHNHNGSKKLLFQTTLDRVTKNGPGLRWRDVGRQVLAIESFERDGDGL